MIDRKLHGLVLFLAVTACSYRPPRFREAEVVTVVRDDVPIPTPLVTALPDALRRVEAYVLRAVVTGLDPVRVPEAFDVNAIDEVPTSSWFSAERKANLAQYEIVGAPKPPFRELAELVDEMSVGDAKQQRSATAASNDAASPARKNDEKTGEGPRVVLDASNRRWEVIPDEPYRTGLRPAAGAITSRLFHALGYLTAECYPVSVENGERALFIAFPSGRAGLEDKPAYYLGPTRATGTRSDDPNDKIGHEERRSLRAIGTIAAWVGLDQVRPDLLRDVYLGEKDAGFVQHQIVGLEDALGAATLVKALHNTDPERPPRSAGVALVTLGFSPKERPDPWKTPSPSIGVFPIRIDPENFELSVPFAPADHALPSDVYWIGKRIAAIPHGVVTQSIDAAGLDEKSRKYLDRALWVRRTAVVRHAMSLVSPLELLRFIPAQKGPKGQAIEGFDVELEDRAIVYGVEEAKGSRYLIEVLNDEGDRVIDGREIDPDDERVRFTIPPKLLEEYGYLVVTVRSQRSDEYAPRAMQIHIGGTSVEPKLRGLRH